MNNITVDKDELLNALEENRSKHRTVFEEALEGFHAIAMRDLEAAMNAIRKGSNRRVYVHHPVPKDHTKDYDRAIAMVKMSVGDTISLSEKDFAQYVMDDWGWQREFLSNTYGSATAQVAYAEFMNTEE